LTINRNAKPRIISHFHSKSVYDALKNTKGLQIDYVILRVGDNDLMDLMTHHQEIFSVVKPVARTLQETTFLKK